MLRFRLGHVIRSDFCCLRSCCRLSMFKTNQSQGFSELDLDLDFLLRSSSVLYLHLERIFIVLLSGGRNCFLAFPFHAPSLLYTLQGMIVAVYRCTFWMNSICHSSCCHHLSGGICVTFDDVSDSRKTHVIHQRCGHNVAGFCRENPAQLAFCAFRPNLNKGR